MVLKKEKKYYIFVFLFWLSLLTLPRPYDIWGSGNLSGFMARLRFEDILVPILVIYLWNRKKIVANVLGRPIFFIICLWASFAFIFTSFNFFLRGLPIIVGILFALKELQYLIYVIFFSVFSARNPWRISIGIPTILIVPSLLFAISEILKGKYMGYYGIAALWEVSRATSSEAGAVLGVFASMYLSILFNERFFLKGLWQSIGFYSLVAGAIVAAVSTGSKTGIGGLFSAFVVLMISKIWRFLRAIVRGNLKMISFANFIIMCSLIIIMAMWWYRTPLSERVIHRFTRDALVYTYEERTYGYRIYFKHHFGDLFYDPFSLILGTGLGSPNFITGYYEIMGISLGVDNQYVRRLLEMGILGTICWFLMIASFASKILRNVRHSAYKDVFNSAVLALLSSTLSMSMGHEIFQLIRSATVIYSIIGILLGLSHQLKVKGHLNQSTIY